MSDVHEICYPSIHLKVVLTSFKDPELNSLVLQRCLNCSESVCRHSDCDEYMVIMKRDKNKACHPNCTCIAKRKHNDERASEET